MKAPLLFYAKTIVIAGLLSLTAPNPASAKIFDGGVDSANLGKGDWIYFISMATNQLGGNVPSVTSIPTFMQYEKDQGMNYIIVKMGTGSTNFNGGGSSPQFNPALVNAAHAVGLKIFGYTRSYGNDIPGEIAMAGDCYSMGADGFVFDSEAEWESGAQGTQGPTNAWQMLSGVKTNWPTKFLGHSPFPYISFHSSFPYKEYGYWCDAVMPQCYWTSFGITPAQMVTDLDTQWRNWQAGLTGMWTNAIKPIVPVGQADTASVPASELTAFVNAVNSTLTPATSGGYRGINWWRADLHTASQWTAIASGNVGGVLGAVNPVIVDNFLATTVGTWSTATSSLDKYAADYRTKGQGTGAAWVQFRPSFWTAGNYQAYEWHPQGSNRPTNAPVEVTHNGGATTVPVNQQVNGGSWVSLGTFAFSEGSGQHIRIKDNFTPAGQTVMADAVRFVYVPPSAPSAPSGLSASGASSTEINLTWTDNASNEDRYIIARSTSSAGPFGDVMILAANSTSFTDWNLAQSTTYYYKVRAANAGGSSAESSQASATTLVELIIDNPAATVVGTWSTSAGSADRFGADYRFKNGGTGSAYLQYTPNITQPGDYEVYEWHPQGSNRTTNAPHVISYNGGTTTVGINQKVNGGQWNLLGTFNFASGTAGNVKIQDDIPDPAQVLMADAIRFVMVSGGTITPPAAPSGLTATAVSSSQINLAWTDNSNNEDSFIVARSNTSGGPYSDITTVPANTTAFNNSGLAASTTYYYVVRAVNSGGSSGYSAQASATTLQAPPAAPSGLTATTISSSQINLGWTDNSGNESNFIVGRSTTSGGPYTDIVTLGANVTSYNNTGLSANTTYYYVVRASNAAGSSANSAQASATTLPAAPAAPSGLTATAISSSQINLAWTDNSSNESNFVVARSTTSGGPYTDIVTLGANVTSYNNTGLAAGTTYYYVVRATNAGGSSANSSQASATTTTTAPLAPSGLTATASGATQIDLTWVDNSSNETGFIVARSTTPGGPYTDVAGLVAGSTGYNDTGLSTGVTYYYVVRATNGGGSSPNSNEASATTQASPAAPGNLVATATRAARISLTWADNSSNESNFIIGRSTTAGGPYTDIATNAANTTSFNNTGLTANTTYYYVIRAVNASGASANSAEASATTYETDLLIDNKSAVVVGSWATASGSTDKYSTDYRFASQGAGAAYLQYTPFIATAGNYEVYEWHPQGSNRTTNAPHVINFNGGSTTVLVNQKINGGKWNLLGTFNFAAGSVGTIRIADNFPDATQVVMADAIKLVLPPPPAAPSGLTATTVNKSRIDLAWVDNASNEENIIVARSTTSGGPYTDVATLSANSTSYSDTGLASNTTYYYVVRARNAGGSSANSAQASATTKRAVHVNSITMSWVVSGSRWKSRAVVNVKDAAGVNVPSATVTGDFTGTFNNFGLSNVTGTGGNATITSTSTLSSGTITFTVTGISGSNMQYDSAANVVNSATHSR
jgi:hypothetical protein